MAAPDEATAWAQLRSGNRNPTQDTICGVHRGLFALVQGLPEEQRIEAEKLIVVAYLMGSKMHFKLLERKKEVAKYEAALGRFEP